MLQSLHSGRLQHCTLRRLSASLKTDWTIWDPLLKIILRRELEYSLVEKCLSTCKVLGSILRTEKKDRHITVIWTCISTFCIFFILAVIYFNIKLSTIRLGTLALFTFILKKYIFLFYFKISPEELETNSSKFLLYFSFVLWCWELNPEPPRQDKYSAQLLSYSPSPRSNSKSQRWLW